MQLNAAHMSVVLVEFVEVDPKQKCADYHNRKGEQQGCGGHYQHPLAHRPPALTMQVEGDYTRQEAAGDPVEAHGNQAEPNRSQG